MSSSFASANAARSSALNSEVMSCFRWIRTGSDRYQHHRRQKLFLGERMMVNEDSR